MLLRSSSKTAIHHLIAVSLIALAFFTFIPQTIVFAQGPPSAPINGNALGNSPFANYGQNEVPITVKGVLTILHGDDFSGQHGRNFFYLRNLETNETLELLFAKKAPEYLRSGLVVTARGKAKGRTLYLVLDDNGAESIETVLPAEMIVGGEQSAIVIVANFKDADVQCSVDEIRQQMFTDPEYKSIDDYYQETSEGNVWFTGDVAGPYNINFSSTGTCDTSAWAIAAENAAKADGIDLSAYNRKIYVLPQDNSCGWAGLASLGGSPSQAWIFICGSDDVIAHELGHNLGLNHSAIPTYDYGDVSDVMGLSGYGLRRVNAPHMEQMGWISPSNLLNITADGLYDIAPLGSEPLNVSLPQVLKIPKPDTGEYYYLSYRQAVGFDAKLSPYYLDGVNVHRYKGDGSASRTFFLEKLTDGGTFIDAVNGMNIRQINHNADYVTVEVKLDGVEPTCNPATPLLDVTPKIQSAEAGSTLSYTVSLTNTDSTECPDSTFSLTTGLPNGWSGVTSSDTITLQPGEITSVTLWITSPATIPDDSYGFSVSVADAGEPLHTLSAAASYVVETSCSATAPSVDISPSIQSGQAGTILDYMITVSNTGCLAGTYYLAAFLPEGWTATLTNQSLSLSPGQVGSVNLSVRSPEGTAAGTYEFTVQVADFNDPSIKAEVMASYIVESAIPVYDTEPPTAPDGLSARIAGTNVKLDWSASTDNVGVSGYVLWRNGARVGDTTDIRFVDKLPPDQTSCTYIVTAYDAAGNASGASDPVSLSWKPKKIAD